jgi:hypothetical protein
MHKKLSTAISEKGIFTCTPTPQPSYMGIDNTVLGPSHV